MVAARKRRFTLACCKGSSVQAVACVQIGPKNESVRSFLAQEACMSVCLLNVDPSSPKFKAGAHLCREVSENQTDSRCVFFVQQILSKGVGHRERE